MAEGKKRKVDYKKNDGKKKKVEPTIRPRRHADVVERGKILWNQLRQKTLTKDDRRKLLDELIPLLMDAKPHEIALQHDGSRLVQAVLQFGTAKERSALVLRLDEDTTILELACSQYAHFVLLKIFKYCEKAEWEIVTSKLSTNMPMLAVHATASRVVEAMFQSLPKDILMPLKQELYGPHMTLFYKNIVEKPTKLPTLEWNLEQLPSKRETTIEFVRKLTQKGISKNLLSHGYFQSLLCEFLEVIPATEVRSSIAPSVADHVLQLVATRAGSRAAALVIGYATVKDRKRISKSLKGYGKSGLLHKDAYLAILRLVQVTDDTVAIQKNILAELLQEETMLEVGTSATAAKLILMLLHDVAHSEDEKRAFLDPYEQSVLSLDPKVEGTSTSKKETAIRAKEHFDYLLPTLTPMVSNHTEELLKSIAGQSLVVALYRHDDSLSLRIPKSLLHDAVGHRGVQKLTKIETTRNGEISRALLDEITLDDLLSSNRSAFCAVSLLEAVPDHAVWKSLTAKKVETAAESSKPVKAGYDALLKTLSAR